MPLSTNARVEEPHMIKGINEKIMDSGYISIFLNIFIIAMMNKTSIRE
jgi:hypothetical protein